MRTTITLDDDVASRLERLKKERPFKELVNQALRAGLEHLEGAGSDPPSRYTLRPVKGRPRRTDLDNINQVLAEVEGDTFR